jgi:hypothetical protein
LAATPTGVVNNCGSCKKGTGSFAFGPARSTTVHSARVPGRLPAGPQASVLKSERTPSREDPVSARLRTEAQATAAPSTPRTPHRKAAMSCPESPFAYFAGFDWAKHSHHVVIVNAVGQIVAEFSFEHTQEGWQQWRQQAARFAPLAVAIESEPRHRRRSVAADARLYGLPDEPERGSSLPGSPSPRAAPRVITWMAGVLPTPCAWIARIGSHSAGKTPC